MKKQNIYPLNEKDEEIVEALISLGMSRPVARVFAYLQHVNEATSLELETGTGLRQPDVSRAMKPLKERDWIKEKEDKKGRPYKIYSLNVGFNDIISQLEKQQKKAIEETHDKFERLKELGKD